MLPSGNDASMVLAENFGCLLYFDSIGENHKFSYIHSIDITDDDYIDDYLSLFLIEMNKMSSQLSLKNTKFINPHGLSSKLNYSCAHDMSVLT